MYASLPAVSKVSVRSRTSIVLCADNSFSFYLSIQKKDGDSSKGRRLQRRPIKRRHLSDWCSSQTRFHSITCPASEGRDHFRRLSSGPAPLHRRSACSSCEQIELQAKLLNYFLGSNKSNINQYMRVCVCMCVYVGVRMCVRMCVCVCV